MMNEDPEVMIQSLETEILTMEQRLLQLRAEVERLQWGMTWHEEVDA
jgi:hypothetical protein